VKINIFHCTKSKREKYLAIIREAALRVACDLGKYTAIETNIVIPAHACIQVEPKPW
jgi:hypothetical protein